MFNSIYKKIICSILIAVIVTLPIQVNSNLIMNRVAAGPPQSTYLANLVAHWSGDNTLNDSSGNARHMAWGDETGSYRTDRNDAANGAFDIFYTSSAANSFTTIANDNAFEGNGDDLAGAFFIKFDELPSGTRVIMGIENTAASGSSWYVGLDGSNQLQFRASNGSFWWSATCTSVTLSTGVWYHVYFAFDDSSNTVDIKVNDGTTHQDTGFTIDLRDLALPLTIGRQSTASIDAAVDDVIILSRELTSAEITHHYTYGVVY